MLPLIVMNYPMRLLIEFAQQKFVMMELITMKMEIPIVLIQIAQYQAQQHLRIHHFV